MGSENTKYMGNRQLPWNKDMSNSARHPRKSDGVETRDMTLSPWAPIRRPRTWTVTPGTTSWGRVKRDGSIIIIFYHPKPHYESTMHDGGKAITHSKQHESDDPAAVSVHTDPKGIPGDGVRLSSISAVRALI